MLIRPSTHQGMFPYIVNLRSLVSFHLAIFELCLVTDLCRLLCQALGELKIRQNPIPVDSFMINDRPAAKFPAIYRLQLALLGG
jgi:hypothetical protein